MSGATVGAGVGTRVGWSCARRGLPRPVLGPGLALALGLDLGVAAGAASPFPVVGPGVGLRLGLGLDVAPGEAVSAGPVWDVSRYLLTDGAVSLTGPSITLTPPYEVVVGFSRDTVADTHFAVSLYHNDVKEWVSLFSAGSYHGLLAASQVGPYLAGGKLGSVAFAPVRGTAAAAEPGIGFNGGPITYGGGSVARPARATEIRIGRWQTGASGAGLRIRWVGVVASGEMSSGSRTAVGGSPLADPRDLSGESFAYLWPMGLVYDAGGGVYKVRDLITTDGTTDATVVGGDLGDFPEA